MSLRLSLVYFFTMAPLFARGNSQICYEFFTAPSQKAIRVEYKLESNDAKVLKILRRINLVFYEYPREYMENSRTVAKVTIPASRWDEIFKDDYTAVIEELSRVHIYRVETYEDGSESRTYDAPLLVSFGRDEMKTFPHEWVPTQPAYSFQFDRRILNLMERLIEPAHVAYILELGTIDRERTDSDVFY